MYFTYHCNQLIYKIQLGKKDIRLKRQVREQRFEIREKSANIHQRQVGGKRLEVRGGMRKIFIKRVFVTSVCFPLF